MNKILVEKFNKCIDETWQDKKMQDYCKKKLSNLVELKNGCIISFEKPTIETRFCFGYGYNGISSQEDMKSAFEREEKARKDIKYFMSENLKDIDYKINKLVEIVENKSSNIVYICNEYGGQVNNILKSFTIQHIYDDYYKQERFEKLEKEDIEIIIGGLKEQKRLFVKRLETYLKKYGLSKLNTWTYLVD